MAFDAAFEKAFQPSIKAYLELKDALVQSDTKLANVKSEAFRNALELLTIPQRDASNMYWSLLHKASKGINKDVTIEKQRESFRIISNHMIEMIQNFDTLDQQLTVQFCPMANNDKGAYWLSNEEKIRNPYFGDMMLTCGEVKQRLGFR
jgi:Cu(I)/Ag(I) efflux system membrane fusion protein